MDTLFGTVLGVLVGGALALSLTLPDTCATFSARINRDFPLSTPTVLTQNSGYDSHRIR